MKEILNIILVKLHLWVVNKTILPEGMHAEDICYAFTLDQEHLHEDMFPDTISLHDSMSLAWDDLVREEEVTGEEVGFDKIEEIALRWCQDRDDFFKEIMECLLGAVAYEGDEELP